MPIWRKGKYQYKAPVCLPSPRVVNVKICIKVTWSMHVKPKWCKLRGEARGEGALHALRGKRIGKFTFRLKISMLPR